MRYFAIIAILTLVTFGGCGKKETPSQNSAKASAKKSEARTAKEKAKEKESAPIKVSQNQVNQKVLSFNLEGLTEKGEKKWDVTGESAEAVSESEIKLDNIVARAYGEESSATITADSGVYDKTRNNVRLKKNVRATIENEQGDTSNIGNFSQAAASTEKKSESLPVKSKKTKTIITCDGEVEFNYEQNQAYFNQNVKVVNEDTTIYADKITVNMDPATRRMTDIIAEGHVRIVKGENTTYSEKATYVDSEKKVKLTGAPKIVISQDGGVEDNFLGKGK